MTTKTKTKTKTKRAAAAARREEAKERLAANMKALDALLSVRKDLRAADYRAAWLQFAAAALGGLLADPNVGENEKTIASASEAADAMLHELRTRDEEGAFK